MAKKSVPDSTLSRLWSRAVIAKYKRCAISGRDDALQAHHIILKGRQNRYALRWDIRNGVPLHPDVHRKLHDGDLYVTKNLLDHVQDRGDMDYLQGLKYIMAPDFLKQIGMTDGEYRLFVKHMLRSIIEEEK